MFRVHYFIHCRLRSTVPRSAPLGTARRRLDLQTPTTHRPCAVNRFYTASVNRNVIVPESPIPDRSSINDHSITWQPGQVLPIDPGPSSSLQSPNYDLEGMIQSMQYAVDSKFDEVKEKLAELESKVKQIEEKQQGLDSASHSSVSGNTSSDGKRRRKSPPELQVNSILSHVGLLFH